MGPGVGDYTTVTTYRYVGMGAGEFNPMARKFNYCLVIVPLSLLLIPLLWLFLQPATTITTSAAPEPPPLPTTSAQSCEGDESTWSTGQKMLCCEKVGKGCPTTPKPPPPPPPPAPVATTMVPKMVPVPAPVAPVASEPYDCNAGYFNWQAGWSVGKKAWCCQNKHMGCVASEPYDCNAGYSNWQAGWSVPKMTWCCQNKHMGCA